MGIFLKQFSTGLKTEFLGKTAIFWLKGLAKGAGISHLKYDHEVEIFLQ